MKTILRALFILLVLFAAACSKQPCDIIESSTNGVTGIKMPIYVTFKDNVTLKENGAQNAVSISPSIGFDVLPAGMRMLQIIPKSPLKYDTRYQVTIDAGKLTGGQIKGVAEFEFSTPKLRFSYNDSWLQQSADMASYLLVGEVLSSDYAESDYVEKNLKIKGAEKAEVNWTHSQDGLTHQYTVANIVPRNDGSYTLTLDFNYEEKKSLETEIPQKGEYVVIGHSVAAEPLSIVITFSEPIKPNQDLKNRIRFDVNFRTSIDKNRLYIYPESHQTGDFEVEISREVLSKQDQKLPESYAFTATLPSRVPAIRFSGKGSILPSSNNMNLLFESVNYQKARVRVRQIFANNLMQFFQRNYYNDEFFSDLNYVSRIVRDTTIDLASQSSTRLDRINTYSLDLSRLITAGRKSMYMLEIKGLEPLIATDEYDYDYYFGDYRTYKERSKVILQSDIGILCKSNGDNEYIVYTTNLISAQPKGNCKVRLFDQQNQPLAESTTNSEGRAALKCSEEPYLVMAEADGDIAFIKVERGTALSLSNFDVGGTTNPKGIKGFLFGERGVWRPGDAIYLTFIVSSDKPLPENHPASLEFYNPNGQLVQSLVGTSSSDGIYTFKLHTSPAAPTGSWLAKASFGGPSFEKTIRVDAIKPNRMKIEMQLGDGQRIDAAKFTGNLTARWLHGAPANSAKVTLQAQLSQIPTRFKGYEAYSFDDATKYFETEECEVASGTTDAQGNLKLTTDQLSSLKGLSPGLLSGKFTVKVFEKSGDFSVDQQIVPVSPYNAYFGIGVTAQKSEWGDEYLDSKRDHAIRIALLDPTGNPINSSEQVTVSVYKMNSYWWWDASSSNSQANYAKSALNSNYKKLQTTLSGGKGQISMRWSAGDYGYYLIRVTSARQAHSATRVVCVSSSDYRGDISSVTDAATRLAIAKDKEKYVPGEKAKITIPSSPGARALISVESGSFVRESFWIDCAGRQTSFEIPIKEGMAPNIYASVTLIQPHNTTRNDAPIRLFGVVRLPVEDVSRLLTPIIDMPESVKPESEVTIRVKEKNGRKMSYVLALVDDGLLGLTRFKTPNPYLYFNATEALGVRTWDLFDYVIGAYGGKIEQLFAIGGDTELPNTGALRAQRFKPVVHFIDAQKLGAGKTNTHKIELPPYFGSVRVMVIASNGQAFGSAEKDVAVKKPLLVQATMPRVISTDEEVEVPVTVFALEKGVGKIDVKITADELFSVMGPHNKTVTLNESGETVVSFRLKVGKLTGIGRVHVTATSSGDNSASEIELDVREPNPYVTESADYPLKPGETTTLNPLKPTGSAKLELSSIPAIDLSRRLEYLIRYPHGCIEQITSGAFPQLYLPSVMECDNQALQDIDRNIKSVLSQLGSYQLSSGAFSYWSGESLASDWGTVYATHFLTEAVKHGYSVDRTMVDRAIKYLRSTSTSAPLTQAYAQYVLALNNAADRGAMNRLREKTAAMNNDVRWMLAAAYTLDGNRKVAEELISQTGTTQTTKANPYDGTYNSGERQMAVVLMTQTMLGHREEAFRIALKMSDILKTSKWLSTQSTAWMLNTLSNFAVSGQTGIDAKVGEKRIKTDKSIASMPIAGNVAVKNGGNNSLYAVVSQSFTPDKGEEAEAASGIRIDVRYKDMNGATLDPVSLSASTDFYAIVTVTNTGGYEKYTDLALTHIVPAGWEITSEQDLSTVTYQDIRDDRILSYFDLQQGESKEIPIKLTATYKGRYYLPSIYCEAMYDNSVRALAKGKWIEVVE